VRALIGAVTFALVLGACGGSSTNKETTGTTAVTTSTTDRASSCPNPDDGMGTERCLGTVAAGTYTTAMFAPPLTYTVPTGWQNLEDLQGNFLLIPPHSKLAGVDAGTTDFIGVYTSVRAPRGCDGNDYDPAVPATVADYVQWLHAQRGLVVSNERAAVVGGRRGTVVDITVSPQPACRDNIGPYTMMLFGTNPSSVAHGVGPDLKIRLYLLQSGPFVLAVEEDDTKADTNVADFFPAADAIVTTFRLPAA
jgi:hypothetical protein